MALHLSYRAFVLRDVGRINGNSFGVYEGLETGVSRLDAGLPVGGLAGIGIAYHAERAARRIGGARIRDKSTGEDLGEAVLDGSGVGGGIRRPGGSGSGRTGAGGTGAGRTGTRRRVAYGRRAEKADGLGESAGFGTR